MGESIDKESDALLTPLRMGRPTYMQDVAREAGVHRSTVSLALRNHPRIPLETRERVQRIAQKLGYQTNPMVAALMQFKKSGQPVSHAAALAYLTTHPGRYDWRSKRSEVPDFFPGAAQRARELGYKLEDYWLMEPGMTGARMSQILHTRNVAGIIVAPLPPGSQRIELAWEKFCTVSLGISLTHPLVHRVAHNHFHTMKMAVAKCREAGCQRIGLYVPRVGYHVVWEHWIGAYLTERTQSRQLVAPYMGAEMTPGAFIKWYRRERPDAVIFGASNVPQWLESEGVRIPADVSLVNLHVAERSGVLSGVYYDPATTGAESVNQLVGLINRNEVGLPEQAHDFLIHGHWADGKSLTKKAAK